MSPLAYIIVSNVLQACLECIFIHCSLYIYLLVIFFSEFRLGIFYCLKISSHQASTKPRSSKCGRFCFPFDLHKGRVMIPVSPIYLLAISANFTEEQQTKIKHRRRYTWKQKSSSKDDLDLLGDDEESFTGIQADLEGAAENLFSSPPRPQPLRFESLSLKTPHTVPPTPGTALQNKIESRLEKSLGNSLNIQLKQEMGVFQDSMLEAMKSLRDEMLSFHKASDLGVVKTSNSAQVKPLPGTSSQPDPPTLTSNPTPSEHSDVQPMDLEPYEPPLPPKSSQHQSEHASKHSDVESDHSERISDSEYYEVLNIRSIQIRGNTNLNPAMFLSRRQRKMSPLPKSKHLQSLSKRFLQNLNLRTAQIQCFIGR